MNTKLYVSTFMGLDSNTGLAGSPFKTIAHALKVAKPHTDIIINPGKYYETLIVRQPFVRLIGKGHKKTVICPPLEATEFGVFFYPSAHDSTIQRCMVIGHGLTGIKVAADNVLVSSCHSTDNGWKTVGFGGSGIVAGEANGIVIRKTICDFNREHGIYLSAGGDNTVVTSCTLAANGDKERNLGGNGLQINADGKGWPSKNLKITKNFIMNNIARGISAMGMVESLIEGNTIKYNNDGEIGLSKGSGKNVIKKNWIVAVKRSCIDLTASGNYPYGTNNIIESNELECLGTDYADVPITFLDQSLPFIAANNKFFTKHGYVGFNQTTKKKYTEQEWVTSYQSSVSI